MKLVFYIASKYFFTLYKHNVVNIIAFISMLGVFFGTMAMIIVLSVFNGFDNIIQNLYYNIDPDIRIELREGNTFQINNTLINQYAGFSKNLCVTIDHFL